ncbi:PREDICTED: ropporin-1-like protein isoform X2 [Polistes dominula]|uniref:Ropporin-1-like protein isoform X2 n=1 Tax=Polistes dominula TaxID=743375 RepID=A0ABM1IP06_POLDO|nr:PREDICTED: ropporin-1-like protein isoform X2 [Polistes dominula]
MPLIEQGTSNQKVTIPPRLPTILKQFCKAAIRTQPYDLLRWSSAYFRALADGEEPPVKLRLEYPPPSTASGLTLGFLRVLLRQFGDYNKTLSIDVISRRWECLCLDRKELNLIMMIGKFRRKCQVKKFLAIAVGLLGSSLRETMIMICELFTHEPDGGSAMVPVTLFMEIYGYLAGLRCDGSERSSSDEDPTEFLVFDESNSSSSSKGHESLDNISIDRVYSIASQDTDADVNLDLDLISKEAADSSNKISRSCSTRDEDSNNVEDKISCSNNNTEESSSDRTLKREEDSNVSDFTIEPSKSFNLEDVRTKSSKSEDKVKNVTNDDANGRNSSNKSDVSIAKERKKFKIANTQLLSYYPNIPGIGPRLSPEDVASVAVWMSECARLQEGMIGPRNLRHPQCPPLCKQKQSES